MHRAIFGRGLVRTSVLIPYGIVTVVAAFAWFFAFDPSSGFVNSLPFDRRRQGLVRRARQRVRRDHHGRGLEDDAVHGAAAARRPGDDRRGPLRGGARSTAPTPWQRFFRITLPLLKPALLVALLFRTLDAFRVFDSIFVMTRGSQDTESVSILGYNQLISRLNLGLGSAVSVLIFILVLLIAFVFVAASAPRCRAARGRSDEHTQPTRTPRRGPPAIVVVVVLRADPGAVDRLAVAEDARRPSATGGSSRRS